MGMIVPNLRPDLDAMRVDLAVANLRDVIKDGWSVLALSTGMVDAFTDQTGIASLGGATYSGGAKTVSNPGSSGMINRTLGSIIGDMTVNGGLAAAFDGVTAQGAGAAAAKSGTPGYVGKDWGAGNSHTISKFVYYGSTDQGIGNDGTGRIRLYGSNSAPSSPTNGTLLWDGGVVSDVGAYTITVTSGITTTTAYRYHWLCIDSAGSAGTYVAECEFWEDASPAAGTVVSNAFALGFQPSLVRIVAPMELGAGVLNTNGLFDLSRDGATWSSVTLADLGKFDASTRIVGGLVNLAGQPAGSSIYWRWRTTAGVAQALHGVWLQCK